jgi:hypothetical protein
MTPVKWSDEFTASFTGRYVDLDSDVETGLYVISIQHVIQYVTSRYTPYALFEMQLAKVQGACGDEADDVGYDGLDFWVTADL